MNRQYFLSGIAYALAGLGSVFAVAAEDAIPQVRIARFPDDRAAAISYTFDDNLRDQYTLAVPMLDEVGFKGTFFVIPGRTAETPEEGQAKENEKRAWGGISWPELKAMAEAGHEIASHTWSHPNLQKLPPEQVEAEMNKASEAIRSRIGAPPLTLAFPFNASTPEIEAVALKHYVAYRDYQTGTSAKTTDESLKTWTDKLVDEGKWGVLMVHAVAKGYAALTDPEILRRHLQHVKGREAEIWVDTFANVARYAKERDDAKLEVSGRPGGVTCVVRGTLDPLRFDVPLTIVIDAPGAAAARAERGGKALPVRIGDSSLYVQAVPSPLPIVVTWN